jgi:hypothetical protein
MKVIVRTRRGKVVATYDCTNPHILDLDRQLRSIYPGHRISYILEG